MDGIAHIYPCIRQWSLPSRPPKNETQYEGRRLEIQTILVSGWTLEVAVGYKLERVDGTLLGRASNECRHQKASKALTCVRAFLYLFFGRRRTSWPRSSTAPTGLVRPVLSHLHELLHTNADPLSSPSPPPIHPSIHKPTNQLGLGRHHGLARLALDGRVHPPGLPPPNARRHLPGTGLRLVRWCLFYLNLCGLGSGWRFSAGVRIFIFIHLCLCGWAAAGAYARLDLKLPFSPLSHLISLPIYSPSIPTQPPTIVCSCVCTAASPACWRR